MASPDGDPSRPRPGATLFDGPLFDSFDGWARLLRGAAASDAGDSTAPPSTTAPPPTADAMSAPAEAVAPAEAEVPAEAVVPAEPPAEAVPWSPRRRPPMALLRIVDDGRDDGETLRLRGDSLVIGRTTGGVAIPHDAFLDEAHARIDRLPAGGWLLTDLGSRDGTWVRVTTARLRPGLSIRVGSTVMSLRGEEGGGGFLVAGPGGTRPLPCPMAPFFIGRDGAWPPGAGPEGVTIVGLDDPHVSPIHAEVIVRRGGLRIVNHGLNGLWARITAPVRLLATAQFQCGEQRFVLEPLGPPGGAV